MHASSCTTQRFWHVVLPAVIGLTTSVSASAQIPLHQQIDQTFQASASGPVADSVDDLTFARRIYLDLTGRIPSIIETRKFLASADPNRRIQLVDKLLATTDCSRQLAHNLNLMLMERRGGKHVKAEELQAWFQTSMEEDKPFHKLAAEMIAADPTSKDRAPSAFFLERDVEPNLLTREIGRMFLGMDLQCAQCHDHPNVDDYKQEDYYGLYAFVGRSSLFQPDKKKPAVISEQADGQAPFKSVFTDREAFTSPRLPGETEIVEPTFAAGEEYHVRPSKTVAGVPRYSRRAILAERIASGENHYFRRNIANRLWAMVMGRGLVHPVDMHHSMNPPSHPQLLSLLASELAAMDFNVKMFVRELVLTDIYQRSHRFGDSPATNPDQLTAAIAELEKQREQANAASQAKEAEAQEALDHLDEIIATAEPIRATWAKARAAAVAAATKRDAAETAKNGKVAALTAKQTFATNLSEALASVTAATTLLGNPKDIAATAATLKTRVDKSAAETEKLKKELAAATKAATTAAEALAKATVAEQAEQQKLTPLKDSMRQHRAAMVSAWKDSQRAYELVTYSEQKTGYLTHLKTQAETAATLPVTTAEASRVRQQQKTMTETAVAAAAELATATAGMNEADSLRKQAEIRAKEMAQQLQSAEQAGQKLTEALASAKAAATSLPPDPAIAQITTGLEQSVTRVNSMMGETQSQLEIASSEMEAAARTVEQLRTKATAARQQAETAKTTADELGKQLATLQQQLFTLRATQEDTESAVIEQSTRQFHLATVEPLTPEQLAWSILQASGQLERQVQSELAKLNKEKPLTDDQKTAEALAKRQLAAEDAAVTTLTKTADSFIALFAAQKGQPQDGFFATVDQALFFANGSQIRGWLAPAGDNLTGRLLKLESADQLAEELYLTTLVRKPSAEEIQDVAEYLKGRAEKKNEAVQELAWALITSAEFRFQY